MTTYNKNNRVLSYALYGVPKQEAYGWVPTDEVYCSSLQGGMYQFEKDRLADEQALRDELRKNMQAIFPTMTQSSGVDESDEDVEECISPYNISRFLDEVNRVHGLNISDVNKHQYISCLMGRSGPLTGVIGLLGGVAWEGADHFRPEIVKSYGGRWNLLNNNI